MRRPHTEKPSAHRVKKKTDKSGLRVRRLYRTERTSEETRQKLVDLRKRLEAAQQERARRIEYDAIAKTIARLPDRQKGKECVRASSPFSFPFSQMP